MNIEINVESDVPIFTQLVDNVKQGVLSGNLQPGAGLPSIRQLANDLGVNPNTVSKAYKLLERDKIIVGKGYRGTFISDNAKSHCYTDLNAQALEIMKNNVENLRQLGLTDSEIRIAFSNVMKGAW